MMTAAPPPPMFNNSAEIGIRLDTSDRTRLGSARSRRGIALPKPAFLMPFEDRIEWDPGDETKSQEVLS